ncbi:InlB B-repeat-containing protein [Kurthia sibirica]|uniref:Bacterial repeat domain-containing protein n=1 Tax=Kurthia sibirica TaxID=202750 RepID=A0A2U3ALI7_9BACL|nr:InlB B-repeat-containing protein [Kurthia sibirica]PWI25403.1 hypothetical protein DEX24_08680 [Kurthia sibirica]GEK34362.1 hypothetical protein KSI01_18950 [Kurthia sibirica]
MIRENKLISTALASVFVSVFCLAYDVDAKTVEVSTSDDIYDVTENMTEDTTIKLADHFVDDEFEISNDSEFNIIVDGNHIPLSKEYYVSTGDIGTVTLKNMLFDGSYKEDDYELILFAELRRDTGHIMIEDSKFINITNDYYPPLAVSGDESMLTIKNTLFDHNESPMGGGLITEEESPNMLFENSTFSNNTATEPYSGGAMTFEIEEGHANITINNSRFINNKSIKEENYYDELSSGGIYLSRGGGYGDFNIVDSYFEGNVNEQSTDDEELAVGGAVLVTEIRARDRISIKGTTFNGNKASGGGGALAFSTSRNIDNNLAIENSTFYNNSVEGLGDEKANGGAILITNLEELQRDITRASSKIFQTTNNTYYKNQIKSATDEAKYGGAIASLLTNGENIYTNDINIGNTIENAGIINQLSRYKEIYDVMDNVINNNTIGFDNGAVMTNTAQEVFGKYPVSLNANHSVVMAGTKDDQQIVPTLPIAPKLETDQGQFIVGLANEHGKAVLTEDQRGFSRLGKQDNGAIEIASVVYHANTGRFTLPEMTVFNGSSYYEGTHPQQYADIGYPNQSMKMIDAVKKLKASKTNYTFIGWSTSKTAKLPETKYAVGQKIAVVDQVKLYAVWKENKSHVIYQGNGNTSGIAPSQRAVAINKEITIKKPTTLKKKGYLFSGWSTKATVRKADSKYAPGKKVRINKKLQLFAVWKRL